MLRCFTVFTLVFFIYSSDYSWAQKGINITEKEEKKIIEVSISNLGFLNKASNLEQDRLVRRKLIQEGYQFNKSSVLSRELANSIANYLSLYKNNEEKITELSVLLFRPLGKYGSKKKDKISHSQKITVIHEWLKRSIFGMSFIDWILNEVREIKKQGDNSLLTHRFFEEWFLKQLQAVNKNGKLSTEARIYYLSNLLKEDMPSILWQPKNKEELVRLQLMNLIDPEFGYLHVGLKVLRDMQLYEDETWSIDDIENIGILIESLIREENIDNIKLFELPAIIYYASTLDTSVPPRKFWGLFYQEYFDHLKLSNPFVRLMEPLNNWKNRSTLARQILKENDVSEYYLDGYLYRGDYSDFSYPDSRGNQVPLPSIDDIFDKQNRNVRSSFRELDKLNLLSILNKTDTENQKFIQSAEINLVQAKLLNDRIRWGLIFTEDELEYDSIVKNLGSDNIDLLQCLYNNEERNYMLDNNNFELHRVDRDRKKILSLYNDTDPGSNYRIFELQTKSTLKKSEESMETFINELSKIHSEKFYKTLKNVGYEPTLWQKFDDFIFSLIVPFYSCFTELKNGNYEDAGLPCTIDFVSLVPFLGKGIYVAYKFGTALATTTIHTVKLAAKQATIYQMLRQASKYLTSTGIPRVQKTFNLRVIQSLGYEFLQGIDPGVGLLRLGGSKFIQAITIGSKYLKKEFPKLETIVQKLARLADKELVHINLLSKKVLKTKHVKLLPDTKQEAEVVKIDTDNGKDLLVRINEKNEPFGRKYIEDPNTGIIDLAPFPIRDKKYHVKTRKLDALRCKSSSGRRRRSDINPCIPGNIDLNVNPRFAAAMWENSKTTLESSLLAPVVYIRSTRVPYDVINPNGGGIRPNQAARYDYNMDQYSVYVKNRQDGKNMDWASPFVATSSNPETALRMISDETLYTPYNQNLGDIVGYFYKVRPDSKFYNFGESLLAAREVCPPNTERYAIINYFDGEIEIDKYLAKDGFDHDRVIEWAPIIKSEYGDILEEWVPSINYNTDFNSDTSAKEVYTRIAINKPSDAMYMGINIVQEALGVTKNKAQSIITQRGLEDKLVGWITQYNSNKPDLLNDIQTLSGFIQ